MFTLFKMKIKEINENENKKNITYLKMGHAFSLSLIL